MNEKKQWVQHISGQGEKWEVLDDNKASWNVISILSGASFLFPKSEYRLCPAPEVWRDCTEHVQEQWIAENVGLPHASKEYTFLLNGMGMGLNMRLRKVQASVELSDKHWSTGWAFIVEKKVTE